MISLLKAHCHPPINDRSIANASCTTIGPPLLKSRPSLQAQVSKTKKIRVPDRFSRFGRCGDMTSIANWSERTDSTTNPSTTTTGLGASPSRVTTGDELIAEKSDLFREAIRARNVYVAWARKMTNARPNDPKLQEYHQASGKWHVIYGVPVPNSGRTSSSEIIKLEPKI
ncbi:hypothetical protein TNCV_4086621 [Trichonephila clavipes]|nr:hypothetical protein TNCV_4086621 [Trichonephila clavipes]